MLLLLNCIISQKFQNTKKQTKYCWHKIVKVSGVGGWGVGEKQEKESSRLYKKLFFSKKKKKWLYCVNKICQNITQCFQFIFPTHYSQFNIQVLRYVSETLMQYKYNCPEADSHKEKHHNWLIVLLNWLYVINLFGYCQTIFFNSLRYFVTHRTHVKLNLHTLLRKDVIHVLLIFV